MKGTIKLAFVTTGLGIGGAERMLLKVLERLDRDRFKVEVISLTAIGEIGARMRGLGICVHALNMTSTISAPIALWQLARRLRRIHPHVVQTWMYHADLLGGIAAKLATPAAISWGIRHNDLAPTVTRRTTSMIAWLCARLSYVVPDRITVCSYDARTTHIRRGYAAQKMIVLPNGFDLEEFRASSSARAQIRVNLGLSPECQLVGLVARYHPDKNHSLFLAAAGLLHKRMPNVHFVLVGSGVDHTNTPLGAAAAAAGVTRVCHLLGVRDDIPRLMASLDVLASSSVSEAFPNVLGEAMACGVPCAATDVGDSAEIIGDTGRITTPADPAKLASAIESLLLLSPEHRKRLGDQARARIAAHYDVNSVVRQYVGLYEELAAVA